MEPPLSPSRARADVPVPRRVRGGARRRPAPRHLDGSASRRDEPAPRRPRRRGLRGRGVALRLLAPPRTSAARGASPSPARGRPRRRGLRPRGHALRPVLGRGHRQAGPLVGRQLVPRAGRPLLGAAGLRALDRLRRRSGTGVEVLRPHRVQRVPQGRRARRFPVRSHVREQPSGQHQQPRLLPARGRRHRGRGPRARRLAARVVGRGCGAGPRAHDRRAADDLLRGRGVRRVGGGARRRPRGRIPGARGWAAAVEGGARARVRHRPRGRGEGFGGRPGAPGHRARRARGRLGGARVCAG